MDNSVLFIVEVVSAVLCFVLVRFMLKPYEYMKEGRYIGLPLGFALLGISYIFMGLALISERAPFHEEMSWLQLLTQTYAFAFLAVTYYFSKKEYSLRRLWWEVSFAGMIILAVISYLFIFEQPPLGLPDYKIVDEYFRIANIISILYIVVHLLRASASSQNSNTTWITLTFLFIGFAQYSSLIWSIDSSYIALLGAHLLRLIGLLAFIIVAYRAFYSPYRGRRIGGVSYKENPT